MFTDAGVLTLAAFVSPIRADRDRVRQTLGKGDFIEVYIKTPIGTFDRKGLTNAASKGEIEDFPGVNAAYEEPLNPELVLENGKGVSLESLAAKVVSYLEAEGYLGA
jgi:adenylylsulfate kinase